MRTINPENHHTVKSRFEPGNTYFFNHKLVGAKSKLKLSGKHSLFYIEFRDGSFPNGFYQFISYDRPIKNQPLTGRFIDPSNNLVEISWNPSNIEVGTISVKIKANKDYEVKCTDIVLVKETQNNTTSNQENSDDPSSSSQQSSFNSMEDFNQRCSNALNRLSSLSQILNCEERYNNICKILTERGIRI